MFVVFVSIVIPVGRREHLTGYIKFKTSIYIHFIISRKFRAPEKQIFNGKDERCVLLKSHFQTYSKFMFPILYAMSGKEGFLSSGM